MICSVLHSMLATAIGQISNTKNILSNDLKHRRIESDACNAICLSELQQPTTGRQFARVGAAMVVLSQRCSTLGRSNQRDGATRYSTAGSCSDIELQILHLHSEKLVKRHAMLKFISLWCVLEGDSWEREQQSGWKATTV